MYKLIYLNYACLHESQQRLFVVINLINKNKFIIRSPPTSRKFSTGNAGSNGVQSNGHLSSTVATRNNRSRSRSPALRKPIQAHTTVEPSQVSTLDNILFNISVE